MDSKNLIRTSSMQMGLESILDKAGRNLTVGAPLGVGKPNGLLNLLWGYARANPDFKLHIFTALSLALPKAKSLLERRFLNPFLAHHFGSDYPQLKYIEDLHSGNVPENAVIAEFYMQSGAFLGNATAQRLYTSSNYTHAARDMADRGVNVIVQLVAHEQRDGVDYYSFGSNPDTTQDLLDILIRRGDPRPLVVGVVNQNMPFMTGSAERMAEFFDILIDDPQDQQQLFAPPIATVNLIDHSIGLHASTLIADGGTLQIGIGSLSDALVHSLKIRHQQNDSYLNLLEATSVAAHHRQINLSDLGTFNEGLFAASEMFMDGFMHLYQAGILKRRVWPDADIQNLLNTKQITPQVNADFFETLYQQGALPAILDDTQLQRLQKLGIIRADIRSEGNHWLDADGQPLGTDMRDPAQRQALIKYALNQGQSLQGAAILQAAFFLGSKSFYHWLQQLDTFEREQFQMTAVSQVNELYGGEALDRAQRIKARFVNTTMKVTLLGAAASDGLENNQIVSGVGGQYNFVAMAHALPDSRSILMLRSCHGSGDSAKSNIVWTFPYDTIPRHLRDTVVTEYGIAVLRGKSDEDCVKAMLCIADSRFQAELLATAKRYGKLAADWQIPSEFSNNTRAGLKARFASSMPAFPEWPFGSDFSDIELQLIKALGWLKTATASRWSLLKSLLRSIQAGKLAERFSPEMERMNLLEPQNWQEKLYQHLLLLALSETRSNKHQNAP